MTQTEALRLALEALGWTDEWRPQGLKEEAITVIKETLAQPEQKSVAMADYMALTEKYVALKAAQRTWVGLTDEDEIDWEEGGNLKDLVKAIEAKLKDKNT
jgi:hypothetical protein